MDSDEDDEDSAIPFVFSDADLDELIDEDMINDLLNRGIVTAEPAGKKGR